MSNVLSINKEQTQDLIMWDDAQKLEEIRKLFAPTLSDMEFKFFVGLGRASRLNPFAREIWAIKYQQNVPAQVFIGRDGYRKAAQAHADYDFHQCDAVYENDSYEVNNGEVKHSYNLKDRGSLVGAYCIAKRHKSSRSVYVFSEIKEYSTGKSLWHPATGKPATMIKKVAESQCLRSCFQDILGGTYGEEEFIPQDDKRIMRVINGDTNTQKLKNMLGIGETNDTKSNINAIDNNCHKPIDIKLDDLSSPDLSKADRESLVGDNNDGRRDSRVSNRQLEKIINLFTEKNFSYERINKVIKFYEINDLNELNEEQAGHLILQLERAK